jgi:hypothetical protein
MAKEVCPGAEDAMWAGISEVPTAATRAALRAYVDRNLDKYADLPLDAVGPNPTYVVKQWWVNLRWLHDLQVIEHEKANTAELRDIEFKPARMFRILPLCSYDSRHVTVDTVVLHGLAKRVAKRTGSPKPAKLRDFLENQRANWAQYFDLGKAEGSGGINARRTCEWVLKTDGYAVSVLLSKPTAVEAVGDAPKGPQLASAVAAARGKRTKSEQVRPPVSLDDKRVVGVDPGRNDIASNAWKNEAGVPAFSRFTDKELKKKIRLREAQETRRRWRAGNPGLEAALTALPSAKTPCPFEM